MDTRRLCGRNQFAAEAVVAHFPDHGNVRAKAGGLHGLVCTLPAGGGTEAFTQNRFPGPGKFFSGYNQIHYETADD
jgi:hypothetical protein